MNDASVYVLDVRNMVNPSMVFRGHISPVTHICWSPESSNSMFSTDKYGTVEMIVFAHC